MDNPDRGRVIPTTHVEAPMPPVLPPRQSVTILTIDADDLTRRHEEYLRAVRGILNAHHHDPLRAAAEAEAPRKEYAAWWAARGVKLVFKD
jgi:hypothetical protein